jgi:hypothetical protein
MCSLWGTNWVFIKCVQAREHVREQNMVMSPVDLGTSNHCAGEGQEQSVTQT